MSALAAALATPIASVPARQDSELSQAEREGIGAAAPVGVGSGAVRLQVGNTQGGEEPLSTGATSTVAAGAPVSVQDFSSAVPVPGPASAEKGVSDASSIPVEAAEQPSPVLAVDGLAGSSAAEIPRTGGDGSTASSSHHGHGSADSKARPEEVVTVTAQDRGAPPLGGTAQPLINQAVGFDAVSVDGTAAGDSAASTAAISNAALGQKMESSKFAAPGEGSTSASGDQASTSSSLHSRLVVEPLDADRPAPDKRGGTPSEKAERVSQGDLFSSTQPGTSASPQTAVPAINQADAAPAEHSASPSPPTPAGHSNDLSPSAAAAPSVAAPVLQTSQVLQRMDKAEIRIGLQSADFGAIRLHTTVANDQVGAAVSVSHAGLREALLFEAPSLEKAIARHSLRLDSVSVDAGSSNSNFNSFGNNERQQPRAGSSDSLVWPTAHSQRPQSCATAAGSLEASSRLDVRA